MRKVTFTISVVSVALLGVSIVLGWSYFRKVNEAPEESWVDING